jgi:hypothetical protein
MEDLVQGEPRPEPDPKPPSGATGPAAPGQKAAPIIHTRDGQRTQPVQPLNPRPPAKPLSRRAKIALGVLAAAIASGGILWSAAQTFPVVKDEVLAYTVERCSRTSQCVPVGIDACWNKLSAGARAIARFENPSEALAGSAASACVCEDSMCLLDTVGRDAFTGTVPVPGK